jgi:hypothetical protein
VNDPELRELRGVYYTPEPAVSFIVRSVDRIRRTALVAQLVWQMPGQRPIRRSMPTGVGARADKMGRGLATWPSG